MSRWSRSEPEHERPQHTILIAGGRSVLEFDQHIVRNELVKRCLVVGVNDAAVHAKVDVALSMDRLWTEARWRNVTDRDVHLVARMAALKNVPLHYRITPFACDHKSTTMSTEQIKTGFVLNGTNSGMCAMNYAFHVKPRNVWLLGFDMQRVEGEPAHWYPDYEWNAGGTKPGNLRDWSKDFDHVGEQFAKADIRVHVVGKRSALNKKHFPQISFDNFLKEIA